MQRQGEARVRSGPPANRPMEAPRPSGSISRIRSACIGIKIVRLETIDSNMLVSKDPILEREVQFHKYRSVLVLLCAELEARSENCLVLTYGT